MIHPIATWRARRRCFHHDQQLGRSWITSELIDLGRRKIWTCTHCGRMWWT